MLPLDRLLRQSARAYSARPAVTLAERTLTYGELDRSVDGLARRLDRAAVRAGQRVAVLAPNSPALVVGLFAVWRLGAVAVPLNALWREYELRQTLRDAEAVALVAVEAHRGYSFRELLPRLLPELPPLHECLFVDPLGDPADEMAGSAEAVPEPLDPTVGLLLYTSGTTGVPKGAPIEQAPELAGARAMNEVLGAGPEDTAVFVAPVAHAFALQCLLAAVDAGSHAVMIDSTFSFGPTEAAIRGHEATILHGSPTLFATLLKAAPAGLPSLRTGFVAGASCPPAVLERLDALGTRILPLYGLTEVSAATCARSADPPAVRHTTVGRALPGFEVRIAPPRRGEGPGVGSEGEVEIKGPTVIAAYHRKPDETAAAFVDGWFRTGDLGSLDAAGNLRIHGRAKEVVIVAGLNVFPSEVEGLLLTHPDVAQAAVIGLPHPATGEALRAFVVPRSGADLVSPSVLRFARERIAAYKLPYAIDVVPELPLLGSGKPDRVALRRLALEGTREPR